jgi:hypothetical protein
MQNAVAILIDSEKKRLVGERAKPLKVELIVREIAELILKHQNDSRLKWLSPTSVRIDISKLIPATKAQTTSARRRRFKKALEERLSISCWHKVPGKLNTFSL